jgi:predicted nucleic acid-binding protein
MASLLIREVLALTMRCSVYDCLYLATALALGAPLLTADRKLYDALALTPLGVHLRWVAAGPG